MWPFRKKLPVDPLGDFADQQLARLNEQIAQQQADMRRRLDEQSARIESAPITRFAWTPVIDGYGRILALAWKNDRATATRLLDEPGQGRA